MTVLGQMLRVGFMNKEQNYHIDVTEQEAALFTDPLIEPKKSLMSNPANFTKIFFLVLGVHVVLAAVIFGTTQSVSAKEADKKFLAEQTAAEPTPSPAPVVPTPEVKDANANLNTTVQEPVPAPIKEPPTSKLKTETKITQASAKKYTTSYVVKQGDTITSIAKKFKLNSEKLQKINNIKDPNKIVVGQTLKFM